MKFRWVSIFIVYIAAIVPLSFGADVVDRIVAVVEGKVVTRSEAVEMANARAFQANSQPVTELSGDALRESVNQLIDQKLLEKEEEGSPFSPPEAGEAEKVLEEISARFSGEEEMGQELARFHLTHETFLSRIYWQYSILAFVDYRLRPRVLLSPKAMEDYYRETFLPQAQATAEFQEHTQLPSLEMVSGEIERVLTEKEINRLLDEWLVDLRARAKIRIMSEKE